MMTGVPYPNRGVDFLIDTVLLAWFFAKILPEKERRRGNRLVRGFFLLLPVVLYPPWPGTEGLMQVFLVMVLRYILRALFCTGYVHLGLGLAWKKAAYFSCLYTTVYHSALNLITLPIVKEGLSWLGQVLALGSGWGFSLFCEVCTHAVDWTLFGILRRNLPFNDLPEVGSARGSLVLSTAACVIYAKSTISLIGSSLGEYSLLVSVIMVLMHLCLLAMLIFFERFMRLRREQEDERVQELSNAYILKSMETWRAGQESTRALAHDMKNHLLAIRRLAGAQEETKLSAYVDEMLESLHVEARSVETGSDLLDGLIAEKAAEAARDHIELSVVLNSSLVSFVSDADLCTIFGNTLDNAIEASRRVADPAARYIALRGVQAAGQAVVVLTNSCERTPEIQAGRILPDTTKENGLHGVGLKNVLRTVKKYGGFLALDTKTQGRFGLTIMLPIPDEQQR